MGKEFESKDARFVTGLKMPKSLGVTISHLAPEIFHIFSAAKINCIEEHKKADIYAFGLVVYGVLCRCSVWKGLKDAEIRSIVSSGNRPNFPESVQNSTDTIIMNLIELAKACWSQNPADRPSIAEIVQVFLPE